MTISNETKIGALASVAIAVLFFGFNFLKGKNIFERSTKIYAVFHNVEGLENANSVKISGFDIGSVYKISETDPELNGIIVTISLKKDVHIPKNSVASISSGLISSGFIQINKGDSKDYMQNGDTLLTQDKLNLMSQIQKGIDPIIGRLGSTLESLDTLVKQVSSMFDPRTKNNFSAIMANLAASTASLQTMLNTQTGTLARSLKNIDTFTGSLRNNGDRITRTLDNLEKTTNKLSNSKIEEAVASIESTMNELKGVISKVNSPTGTLGLLINDKKLYQNLESTSRSLNILLDDFRVHPKRYVNVSVFGKKDKSAPLTAPLSSDSTANPATNKK
jgi:phospholipid/cholesterol/gamma-HCH transport system substrate-binding protein